MNDVIGVDWQQSSFCSEGGCVAVADLGAGVGLRDTKSTDGAILTYSRDEWRAFVAGVKAGEFDHLCH